MKMFSASEMKRIWRSEEGAALVIAMLVMVVLTIIGVAASNTSVLEILTSNSSKNQKAAFYAAEAGIEDARKELTDILGSQGSVDTWDLSSLTDVTSPEHPGEKYVFQDKAVGNCSYTVTVFEGYANRPGVIYLRSVGTDPGGGRVVLEVGLVGKMVVPKGTTSFSSYGGQQNAGSAKSNAGYDINAIGSEDLRTYQLNEGA